MSGRKIALATIAIMLIHFACRFLGFFEKQLVAHYFGAGAGSDAYFTALGVIMSLYLIIEGLLTHTFIPAWNRAAGPEGDLRQGWRLASSTANILGLLLLIIVAVGIMAAPTLLGLINVRTENMPLAVMLTRIMLPALLFLSLSSLSYVMLNAQKSFALPASGDAAIKIGTIAGILLLGSRFGIAGMAVGFMLGSLGKLAVHLIGLKGQFRLYRSGMEPGYPPLVFMGSLMLPLLISNIASQLRPLADVYFANQMQVGSLSALRFARSIVDIPVQIFPYAFGIAVFPFLSEWASRGEEDRLRSAFASAMRMMAFVFIPLAAATFLLRQPIVGFLFEHGRFSAADTAATAGILAWYSLGMPLFAFEIIILQLYFSLSDMRTPMILGILGIALHIGLEVMLIPHMRQEGIALAMTLSKGIKVLALLALLYRRTALVPLRELLLHGSRVSLAALFMAGGLILGMTVVPGFAPGSTRLSQALGLSLAAGGGTIVFMAAALLLGLQEPGMLHRLFGKRLRGSRG